MIKTMDETPKSSTPATKAPKTNDERLRLLKSRLSVAKTWCKKPHEAWKQYMSEYEIDDYSDTSEIRDKVRIGYLFRKTESELPALFDDQPDIFIKGRAGKTKVKTLEPLIDSLYDFLWDTQDIEEKVEDVGLYFQTFGMGFLKSPWVTKTETIVEEQPVIDEMGQPLVDPMTGQPVMQPVERVVPVVDQPMAYAPNPFKLYFAPETTFATVLDYEHCPYYVEELGAKTKEEILARYGVEVEANEVLKTEDTDVDSELEGDNDIVKDDLKRTTPYEYYGCLPEEYAKDITDSQGNKVTWAYDKEYHIVFTKNEELLVEECPYRTKPLLVLGNYGFATKFFRFGDAKHLLPLIREFEQYRQLILSHLRKNANPKALINTTANVDENTFRSPATGNIVKWDGLTPPAYLNPPPLSGDVAGAIDVVRTDLEKTAGSFDLSMGAGQSTVRTPKGIDVYANAADRATRRKRKKIARFLRALVIYQFEQVAKLWRPEDNHVLEIVGEEGEEAVPVDQEVLEAIGGINSLYNLDIEIESLSVNKAQMRQDSLDLFSLAAKFPNLFNLPELAKDLLQNGFNKKDADRYLISMDQINQQAIQGFIQQLAQTNPQLAGQVAQAMTQPNLTQMQQGQEEGGAFDAPNPQPEPEQTL